MTTLISYRSRAIMLGMVKLVVVAVILGCGQPQGVPSDADPITPMIDGAPAMLEMTPTPIEFGVTVVGAQTMQVVTVSNLGGTPSGSIFAHFEGANADQFFIDSNRCATLAATAACMVNVVYRPSTASSATAQLVVSDGAIMLTADVTGMGVISAALTIDEMSHVFAPTVMDSISETVLFTITNVGGLPTGLLTTLVGGPDANAFQLSDGCKSSVLAPSTSCTISVSFIARAPRGPKAAGFTVTGMPGGNVSATLSGHALAPAVLVLTPASPIDFGFVPPGQQHVVMLTLTNTGDVPSGTIAASLSSGNGDFMMATDQCSGSALDGLLSCNLFVRFGPAISGPNTRMTTLAVTASPGGPVSATLTGITTQTSSSLRISPQGTFGTVALGESQVITFTVENMGTATTGALKTAIKSSQPGGNRDFIIEAVADHCVGVTLLANATCTVDVTFKPLGTANSIANLVVHAVAPLVWGVMQLTGTGN